MKYSQRSFWARVLATSIIVAALSGFGVFLTAPNIPAPTYKTVEVPAAPPKPSEDMFDDLNGPTVSQHPDGTYYTVKQGARIVSSVEYCAITFAVICLASILVAALSLIGLVWAPAVKVRP